MLHYLLEVTTTAQRIVLTEEGSVLCAGSVGLERETMVVRKEYRWGGIEICVWSFDAAHAAHGCLLAKDDLPSQAGSSVG